MGPHRIRRAGAALVGLMTSALFLAAALPVEALARAGSGSSSFGRSLGNGGGYRARSYGGGGHFFFFGGGGGGGGLLLLLIVVVVLLFVVSRRSGGRRRGRRF